MSLRLARPYHKRPVGALASERILWTASVNGSITSPKFGLRMAQKRERNYWVRNEEEARVQTKKMLSEAVSPLKCAKKKEIRKLVFFFWKATQKPIWAKSIAAKSIAAKSIGAKSFRTQTFDP